MSQNRNITHIIVRLDHLWQRSSFHRDRIFDAVQQLYSAKSQGDPWAMRAARILEDVPACPPSVIRGLKGV